MHTVILERAMLSLGKLGKESGKQIMSWPKLLMEVYAPQTS